MMRVRTVHVVVLLTLVLSVHHRIAAADGITPVTVQVIEAWVKAVHEHVPGTPDESVAMVRRLTFQNRVDMNSGIDFFFIVLHALPVSTKGNPAAKQLMGVAHAAGMPDAATFLKRAAVLHTDAVIFAERFPQPDDTTAPPPTQRSMTMSGGFPITEPRKSHIPALLTNASLVKHQDGDVLGTTYADWNWPFARSLLDEVSQTHMPPLDVAPLPTDPFVGAWYHAVASYLFANRLYGDATDHFFHASQILANDPRVLFDRGCYAEILGLPAHQVFVSDWTPGRIRPIVPRLEQTNSEAERLFRRALEVDPSFVEARVHLGRLLGVRGSHAEAATELDNALASTPEGVVGFYARLFAARVAQERNLLDEAAAQYRGALTLFPNAQSALLGLSQVALASGDASAALKTLERLGPQSTKGDADPWWNYALASGRDVNELMHHLWTVSR
jgi:tetratricopeptide (TPR) repeat protein